MSDDTEVNLKLKVSDDGAGAELAKAGKDAEKAAKQSETASVRSSVRQRTEAQKLAQARSTLGVRSERTIQREIDRTNASYNRLAASGKLSANELASAYSKTRETVTRLTNEMGKMTKEQQKQAKLAKVESRVRTTMAVGAGVAAAAYTVREPLRKAMDFDTRLANMVNISHAEQSLAARQTGRKELEETIISARRGGGGTNEGAAEALQALFARGFTDDPEVVKKSLAPVIKAAVAFDSEAKDVAVLGAGAIQQFGFVANELMDVFNAAGIGTAKGSFEFNDLARHMPSQFEFAKRAGLSGREGLLKMVGYNEAVATATGSSDQAGTYMTSLYGDMSGAAFTRFMAGAYFGKNKRGGGDAKDVKRMEQKYIEAQLQGINKIDATRMFMQETLLKDKRYQALDTKLKTLNPKTDEAEYRNTMAAMAQIQGSRFGAVFRNKESNIAMSALIAQDAMIKDVVDTGLNQWGKVGSREIDLAHANIASTAGYQARQAGEDSLTAQKAALDGITPAIGKAAEAFAGLSSKFPVLTGTTVLATTALTAFAGTVGLATIALRRGGGGGIGIPGGVPTTVPSRAPAGGVPPVAGRGGISRAARAGGIAGVIAAPVAYVGGAVLEKGFGADSAVTRYGTSGLNGAAAGATIGSMFAPGIGTAAGAAIGGVGGLLYEALKDAFKDAEPSKTETDINLKATIGLAPGLVVQEQSMQSTGPANVQANTGNIWSGAPS